MSGMIIQVYEIQEPGEAEKLAEIGVNHIGSVILSNENWKNPVIRETIRVTEKTEASSSLIPLYSDIDLILRTLEYYRPDIVHFCEAISGNGGCEDLLYFQEKVKQEFPEIKIMRSIPIPVSGVSGHMPVIELAELFEPVSDFFLTDTVISRPPDTKGDSTHYADCQPVKGFVGITGRTCDWDIAAKLVESSGVPVILAGGISPENVYAGIRRIRPAGVDSCTATNAVDENGRPVRFRKDFEKVRRFVEEARRAGHDI